MEKIKLNTNEILCDDCNCIIEEGFETYIGDVIVCNDCMEEYILCESCNEYYHPDDVQFRSDGMAICKNCIRDDFDICNDCGDLVHRQDAYINGDGRVICDNCRWDIYYPCNNCGELYHMDDLNIDENGDYYCKDCYQPFLYDKINDYHIAPDLNFKTISGESTQRFYGIELEIDHGNYKDELASNLYGLVDEDVFYQYDGSLDDGFEIISHPASYKYHKNKLNWNGVLEMCKDYNFKSHDTETCGIHIHTSKLAFGNTKGERDLNIAKITILFERFWDDIVKFTRRDYNKINYWAKKPTYKFYKDDCLDDIVEKSKYSYSDRYTAVNLRNKNTVEFRIFRGTLKYNTFIANIQFIDVLMDYCIQSSLQDVFDATSLIDILKNKYKELDIYLKERGLI